MTTTTHDKFRAVVLAALMVLSVVAMGTAFVGTAAAAEVTTVESVEYNATGSTVGQNASVRAGTRVDVAFDVNFTDDDADATGALLGLDLGSLESDGTTAASVEQTNEDDVTVSLEKTTGNATLTFDGDDDDDDVQEVTILVSDLLVPTDSSGESVIQLDQDDTNAKFGEIATLTIVDDRRSLSQTGVGLFDTGAGTGFVYDGATVFQGETGLSLGDGSLAGDDITDGVVKVSGNSEGVPLPIPDIPEDQPIGQYTVDGTSDDQGVTVIEPKVTTLEVLADGVGGNDVAGGTILTGDDSAVVNVEYNYETAENITLSVADANGVDVTSEWLDSSSVASLNGVSTSFNDDVRAVGNVAFNITVPDDPGEYTITVEGSDALTFGEASQSTVVTVSDSQTASISLDAATVTAGELVTYTVSGVQEGSNVTVGIEQGDVTDSSTTPQQLFRDVGDTFTRDGTDEVPDVAGDSNTPDDIDGTQYYLAQLEIDDGQAVGSVDTSFLDTGDVTLTVWPSVIGSSSPGADSDDDSVDLTVEEGFVTLDSPGGVYTIGSTVDISGNASDNIDNVALYARGSGDWELVNISASTAEIEVDPDGTFSESDVKLSDSSFGGPGNDLLAVAGSYRLAIVDAEGADADSSDNGDDADDTLNSSAFTDATTDTGSIVTSDGSLAATFTTYNGQIAVGDDDLDVEGTATSNAGDDLVLVLVDARGTTNQQAVTVEDDGSFDETITISNLAEGSVSAHVIAPGSDGTFGNTGLVAGTVADSSEGFIDEFLAGTNDEEFTGTGAQVRSKIIANTVDDTASDDQIVTQTFRYADPRTSIDTVSSPVETDGTLTVEGQTNRDPGDADIILELFDADDTSQVLSTVEDWDSDGAWSAELDLSGLPTGSYTIEADDTSSSDRADVEIVDEVTTPTPEPEPEPEPTPEPTEEPTEDPAEEETPAETPGFGLLVALTALVAAGFLALRRLD